MLTVLALIPRNIYACGGKSKKHRNDIRKMLLELNENQRRRVYPRSDLIPAKMSLAKLLNIDVEAGS